MLIYELEITLLEQVFFASREIDRFFLTEPVLGNYALAYALDLARAPYRIPNVRREKPQYARDLAPLNEAGVYVTPGTPLEAPVFALESFNALTDTYWYQMKQNTVVGDLAYRLEARRPRPANYPQVGRLRLLARGNRFRAFLCAQAPRAVPRYIRLGKFNGKARVEVRRTWDDPPVETGANLRLDYFLNPLDLPAAVRLRLYNMLSIPPVPLVRDAVIDGPCHRLDGKTLLPAGLHFGGLTA